MLRGADITEASDLQRAEEGAYPGDSSGKGHERPGIHAGTGLGHQLLGQKSWFSNGNQFIDLCILLGCDYCDTIPKVGPTTALKLIKERKTIEKVLEHLGDKYKVPEEWPYQDARELFLKPSVLDPKEVEFKWEAPNVQGLVDYLVKDKGFSEDRVRAGAARLEKGLKTSTQGTSTGENGPEAFTDASSAL